MKRLILTFCLLATVALAGAQRYMRYQMNDGSFNGFYTDCIDSIVHTTEHTQVWTFGECHEIPLANIDTITFEGVDLRTDADDMVGRYRIYEYEVSPTDSIYSVYKKAYFDNRALLMTSKTGEFGANDTIMIHSEFYGGSLLMFTDDGGNICRVFDGEYMLDIITHEDGSSTVHLFGESSDTILATLELPVDLFEKYSYTRAVSVSSLQKALKGFVRKFNEDIVPQLKPYLKEKAATTLLINGAEWLSEALTDIESDPNYRNKVIVIDGVQVVGDLAGIGLTALGGALTGGALWAALGIETGMLMADFHELMTDCLPSNEVEENYKKYYEQEYGLMLYTQPAVDVTETSATLNGNVYTADGIKGNVSFRLWDYKGDDVEIDATITGSDSNYKYSFSAQVENLEPDTEYVYWVQYTCTINGITFYYFSDDYAEFRTKEKSDEPTPGEAIDLGLSVKWASHNVGASSPEGYGVYYAWGETEEKSSFYYNNYKYYKYYNNSTDDFDYIGSNISGTQYDVALVKWGGSWRMPTRDEIKELVNKCTRKWTTLNGVNGLLVTGPNGNSIFLPAAGYRHGTDLDYRGSSGYYWSAALNESDSDSAGGLQFSSSNIFGSSNGYWHWSNWLSSRCNGCTVRPVTE